MNSRRKNGQNRFIPTRNVPCIKRLTLSGRLGHLHLADAFYSCEVGEKSCPEGVKYKIGAQISIVTRHRPRVARAKDYFRRFAEERCIPEKDHL